MRVIRWVGRMLAATAATETRWGLYGTAFGTWFLVAVYAMLHDQYLVRICPEHFTEYHTNPYGIEPPWLLALAWAFVASLSPGAALGTANFFIGRAGLEPRVPVATILRGVVVVIVATEVISLLSGLWVHMGGALPYPEDWYPSDPGPVRITQTIQVSTYGFGIVFSGAWLLRLLLLRRNLFRVRR